MRDGAHNPAGARWLADRLASDGPYVVVASILRDKDADAMLAELARLGDTLVATTSENPRALAADELAEAARPHFRAVEAVPDPAAALARARALGRPRPRHRLALSPRGPRPRGVGSTMTKVGERLSVFAFATFVVLAIVAVSFAAGYLIGKLLL